MNKVFRKVICVLMAILMILSASSAAVLAADNDCDCKHVPMIYVYGRQTTYDDPNSPNRRDLQEIKDEVVMQIAKDSLPLVAKALALNDYDELANYFADAIIGLLGDFSCDKEGNIKDNSGIDYNWSPENPDTLGDYHKDDNVYSYVFNYDARLDPLQVADDLKVFIDSVKRVTGHKTVNIISRCMGSQYAMAYFVKYGWADVETFVQNCTSANGTTIMSEIFAGKLCLNEDALARFVEEDPVKYEDEVRTLLVFLKQMKALGVPLTIVNKLFEAKLVDKVMPKALLGTYATCPGYWSMVSNEDYADAMKLIFTGKQEEYKVLIEKLENYDKLVRSKTAQILTDMHGDGVKLCTIAKYGFQLQPITASYNVQSDDKISVFHQSYGATCSEYDKTFTDDYVSKAVKAGHGKYISPDLTIDASTCLFPDTTWFMKDIRHNNFPGCVNELYIAACRSEKELTVTDDARFPQFLRHYYWENSLVPLVSENSTVHEYTGFFASIKNFFNMIKTYIKNFFNKIFKK